MSRMKTTCVSLFLVAGLCAPASAQRKRPHVAVFNFQMKSGPAAWQWLEKGLADRVITEFFHSGVAVPIQRDEMQRVADEVKWAPEMLTDRGRLQMIQQAVKAHYVVSGVYEVNETKLSITGTIVDCATHRQVGQRTVAGTTDTIIDVMAKLSAQLQAWFSKGSVDKHLKELPAWTKSIPAARGVYEGIDLYDRGLFHDAWLKFRQASRSDKGYSEAHYWVGRMYYFMHRYELARQAFEKFLANIPHRPWIPDEDVKKRIHSLENNEHDARELMSFYTRLAQWRPARAGSALKEYVHCLEHAADDPHDLVDTYMALLYRYPRIAVPREMNHWSVPSDGWLFCRSAFVLRDNGKLDQALGAANRARVLLGWGYASYFAAGFYRECAFEKHYLSGKVPHPGEISFQAKLDRMTPVLRFGPEGGDGQMIDARPVSNTQRSMPWILLTEDDCYFTRITCWPIIDYDNRGPDVHLTVSADEFGDVARSVKQATEATTKGFVLDSLPRAGMLELGVAFSPPPGQIHWKDSVFRYRGIKLDVDVGRLGPHGSIRVDCDNVSDFMVKLDGKFARLNAGVIGLLPPKEYGLTICPSRTSSPYGEWRSPVTVTQDKTTNVVGHLPWKPGTPWTSWKLARIPEEKGQLIAPSLQKSERNGPCIQVDTNAIRIVCVRRSDLWIVTSTNGNTFSSPRKLASPVSTSWLEDGPRLIRDTSGRFILAFVSDRNQKGIPSPYVCWSRNLVNWSAPVKILDRWIAGHDILADSQGRFIWVGQPRTNDGGVLKELSIHASPDLYTWERLATLDFPDPIWDAQIVQLKDDRYQLFLGLQGAEAHGEAKDGELYRMQSNDAVHWKSVGRPLNVGRPEDAVLSVARVGARVLAALFQQPQGDEDRNMGPGTDWSRFTLSTTTPNGKWVETLTTDNLCRMTAAMAHHPKWGHIITWAEFPRHRRGPMLSDYGPTRRVLSAHLNARKIYVIRGPGF